MKKHEKLSDLRRRWREAFFGRAPKLNRYKEKKLMRLEKWWEDSARDAEPA